MSCFEKHFGAHPEIGSIPSPPSSLTVAAKERFEVVEEAAERESTASTHVPRVEDVNPYNLSRRRKWVITWVSSFFTFLVACCTTSYTMGYPSMTQDLGCTTSEAVLGLSMYIIAFAVTPLCTAAFSEEVGRQPLYYVSIVVFASMHIVVALAPSIEVVIVARLIQGAAGSTGATMVAGTISDIWESKERGLPMGLYSMGSFVGNAFGTVFSGWIEQNTKLQWKWIQWISLMIAGAYFLLYLFTMQETRASVLYNRQAKKLLASGKSLDVLPPARPPLKELLWVSGTRPLVLLFTEPIVLAITVWVGFAWAMLYCLIGSIPPVFRTLHDFTTGEVGTVYVTMIIGSLIGYATTLFQERIYLKKVRKHSVEARLYMCCVAGIAFPASMFMFAWLCFRQIHWALLCLSLIIYYWSCFTIYLASFSYIADCYTTYASSAIAGQSLLRNILGGVFPLFTPRVADKLGFNWANTIWACIAVVLAPIPFVLLALGRRVRARSLKCVHD